MLCIYDPLDKSFEAAPAPCEECQSMSKFKYLESEQHKRLSKIEVSRGQSDDPEWDKQRSKRLTASDAGSALGNNFHKSADQCLEEKVHGSTFTGNERTEWGQKWEKPAVADFEFLTGHKVHHYGLLESIDNPCLAGSPDGVTYCGKLVEVKCPYDSKGVPKRGRCVPRYYIDQLQMLMYILKIDMCFFIRYKPYGFSTGGVPCLRSEMRMSVVKEYKSESWVRYNVFRLVAFHGRFMLYKSIVDGSFFHKYIK